MNLNNNIPPQYAKIRKEFLYNKEKHIGESEDCVIHSVTTMEGYTPLFNILLPNGAFYCRLPVHAFFHKEYDRDEIKDPELKQLAYWDCMSYFAHIHHFNYIGSSKVKFMGRDNKLHGGSYLFTIDYVHPNKNILDTTHAEIAQEHKYHHFIIIEDGELKGNYAIMPNNKCLFNVPNFTVENKIPDYKVNMEYQSVENDNWSTDDTNNQFYGVKDGNEIS